MSSDNNILTIVGASIVAAIIIFLSIILGTTFGAFVGYVVSLTFLGDWVIQGFKVFEINAYGQLTVIGAMLGFVGGFFKSTLSTK